MIYVTGVGCDYCDAFLEVDTEKTREHRLDIIDREMAEAGWRTIDGWKDLCPACSKEDE